MYVPNATWTSSTAITSDKLNHVQEQYSNIIDYLGAHNHDSRYYTRALMDSYFWNIDSDGSGSGLNADTLEGIDAADIFGGVSPGLIIWWYGDLTNFTNKRLNSDSTWHIADGTDGTIDLLDYFILGAGGSYVVGASGGNAQFKPAGSITVGGHVLTILESFHTHTLQDYYSSPSAGGSTSTYGYWFDFVGGYSSQASTTSSTGGGQLHIHPGSFVGGVSSLLPPFHALIPIQKMAS